MFDDYSEYDCETTETTANEAKMSGKLHTIKENRFTTWLGNTVYKMIGWKVEGHIPESVRKAVIIVAPHTSNWDFPVGLFASFALGLSGHWVGKHTLFRWPFGGLMRWLGGIPINRRKSKNFVSQAADYFKQYENFRLVIAPEGTRRKTTKWKSGFYHIAKEATVPIVCAFIDFRRKVSGIGPIIMPSGDLQKDFEKIRDFYLTVGAKRPENRGEISL